MRRSALIAFILGGLLSGLAMLIWPGCASVRLPDRRQTFTRTTTNDVAVAEAERRTRVELIAQMGDPLTYLPERRVAFYRFDTVSERRLWLFLGVVPFNATSYVGELNYLFLQFDDADRLRRYEIVHGLHTATWDEAAREWQASEFQVTK